MTIPRLELRVDDDLLERLDAARGLVSRSAFVRAALERELALERPTERGSTQPAAADAGKGRPPSVPPRAPFASPSPSLQRHREDS